MRGRVYGHTSFACRYVGLILLEAVDTGWTNCAGAHTGCAAAPLVRVFLGHGGGFVQGYSVPKRPISSNSRIFSAKTSKFDPRIVSVEA